VKFKDEVEDT